MPEVDARPHRAGPDVALVGLGSMGSGMAQSLLRDGFGVHGFDIDAAREERFRAEGGRGGTLDEVAATLDIAVIVVLNASQTEEVLFGQDALVPRLRPGAVVLACATVPPEFARAMEARCAEAGVFYLDAPISGGTVKAAQGALSIMASGTPAAFAAARPALNSMAETVFELGDAAGAGSAMKSVNQMLAGVHIAAMAEAMTFGMTQGVEPAQFLDVISRCAGTSWMLENRAPHVIDGDYTPRSSVDIWLKDLGIVLDIARESRLEAPLTSAALQQFTAASRLGLGHEDDAAVAKVYARDAGIELPGRS